MGAPVLEFESIFRAGGTNETFDMLLQKSNVGNYDPEDLKFIPASKSSTGKPMLLVTGTTSGSLVMYEVVTEAETSSGGESSLSATVMGSTLIATLIGLTLAGF